MHYCYIICKASLTHVLFIVFFSGKKGDEIIYPIIWHLQFLLGHCACIHKFQNVPIHSIFLSFFVGVKPCPCLIFSWHLILYFVLLVHVCQLLNVHFKKMSHTSLPSKNNRVTVTVVFPRCTWQDFNSSFHRQPQSLLSLIFASSLFLIHINLLPHTVYQFLLPLFEILDQCIMVYQMQRQNIRLSVCSYIAFIHVTNTKRKAQHI